MISIAILFCLFFNTSLIEVTSLSDFSSLFSTVTTTQDKSLTEYLAHRKDVVVVVKNEKNCLPCFFEIKEKVAAKQYVLIDLTSTGKLQKQKSERVYKKYYDKIFFLPNQASNNEELHVIVRELIANKTITPYVISLKPKGNEVQLFQYAQLFKNRE